MKRLDRTTGSPRWVPDYTSTGIMDIDFGQLADSGIKYIVLDVDNTLVPNFGIEIDPSSLKFLRKELQRFEGSWIATNRLTLNLQPLASSIGAKLFQARLYMRKPQRRYYHRLSKKIDAKPSQIAMIGDSLWADIWGAKRAGYTTVLVSPAGRDLFLAAIFRVRRMHKFLLRKYI